MNRRPPPGAGQPRAAKRGTVALLVIDQEPLQRAARQERAAILKRLALAQRALERFEESDLPQYEQWQAARFGEVLTRLRELARKAHETGSLVEQVNFMRYVSGASVRRCYEAVMRSREGAAAEDDPLDEDDAAAGEPEQETRRDPFDDFSAEEPGDARSSFDDGFGHVAPAGRRGEPGQSVKQLYRALALKLHPDHRGPKTAREAARLDALWHETQAAYSTGASEELERIDALMDIEQRGISSETDISTIERATQRHRHSLNAVERAVRQAREHPAWTFSKKRPTALAALAQRLGRDLGAAILALEQDIAYFDELISSWRGKRDRAAVRSRRPKSRSAPAAKPSRPRRTAC